MARIRSIKPDFFTDARIIQLPLLERLAFIGLWTQADKRGRLPDDPNQLKIVLFPDQKVDMEAILARLHPTFVIRYEVDGHKYLWIRHFEKHQRPHHTEAESMIPAYTGSITGTEPLNNGYLTVSQGREGKGREGKGREGNDHGRLAPTALGFDDFWTRYPRKVAKKAARKAWERLELTNGLLEKIMEAILIQSTSEAWTKDGGQFIPHPATWLNGRRWEDETMRHESLGERLWREAQEEKRRDT